MVREYTQEVNTKIEFIQIKSMSQGVNKISQIGRMILQEGDKMSLKGSMT